MRWEAMLASRTRAINGSSGTCWDAQVVIVLYRPMAADDRSWRLAPDWRDCRDLVSRAAAAAIRELRETLDVSHN